MNASTWIELAMLIAGGGGGGAAVAKLTRLVVSVETLTRQIEQIVSDARATVGQVRQHETRISRLEGGGTQAPAAPPASGQLPARPASRSWTFLSAWRMAREDSSPIAASNLSHWAARAGLPDGRTAAHCRAFAAIAITWSSSMPRNDGTVRARNGGGTSSGLLVMTGLYLWTPTYG